MVCWLLIGIVVVVWGEGRRRGERERDVVASCTRLQVRRFYPK